MAEEYFDPSGSHLNERIKRADLFASFFEYAGGPSGHGVTRANFKGKIQAYCKFKGYDFNTNMPNAEKMFYSDWKPLHPEESFIGDDDKSGGAEYFTVFSPRKRKTTQTILNYDQKRNRHFYCKQRYKGGKINNLVSKQALAGSGGPYANRAAPVV